MLTNEDKLLQHTEMLSYLNFIDKNLHKHLLVFLLWQLDIKIPADTQAGGNMCTILFLLYVS